MSDTPNGEGPACRWDLRRRAFRGSRERLAQLLSETSTTTATPPRSTCSASFRSCRAALRSCSSPRRSCGPVPTPWPSPPPPSTPSGSGTASCSSSHPTPTSSPTSTADPGGQQRRQRDARGPRPLPGGQAAGELRGRARPGATFGPCSTSCRRTLRREPDRRALPAVAAPEGRRSWRRAGRAPPPVPLEAPHLVRWMFRDITPAGTAGGGSPLPALGGGPAGSLGHVARLTAEPQPVESILDRSSSWRPAPSRLRAEPRPLGGRARCPVRSRAAPPVPPRRASGPRSSTGEQRQARRSVRPGPPHEGVAVATAGRGVRGAVAGVRRGGRLVGPGVGQRLSAGDAHRPPGRPERLRLPAMSRAASPPPRSPARRPGRRRPHQQRAVPERPQPGRAPAGGPGEPGIIEQAKGSSSPARAAATRRRSTSSAARPSA